MRPLTAPSSAALEGTPRSLCWRQGALGDRRWIWGSGSHCPVKSHAHSPVTQGAVSPTLTQPHTRCHRLPRGHPHPVLGSSARQDPSGFPTHPPSTHAELPPPVWGDQPSARLASASRQRSPESRCPSFYKNPCKQRGAGTRPGQGRTGIGLGRVLFLPVPARWGAGSLNLSSSPRPSPCSWPPFHPLLPHIRLFP